MLSHVNNWIGVAIDETLVILGIITTASTGCTCYKHTSCIECGEHSCELIINSSLLWRQLVVFPNYFAWCTSEIRDSSCWVSTICASIVTVKLCKCFLKNWRPVFSDFTLLCEIRSASWVQKSIVNSDFGWDSKWPKFRSINTSLWCSKVQEVVCDLICFSNNLHSSTEPAVADCSLLDVCMRWLISEKIEVGNIIRRTSKWESADIPWSSVSTVILVPREHIIHIVRRSRCSIILVSLEVSKDCWVEVCWLTLNSVLSSIAFSIALLSQQICCLKIVSHWIWGDLGHHMASIVPRIDTKGDADYCGCTADQLLLHLFFYFYYCLWLGLQL